MPNGQQQQLIPLRAGSRQKLWSFASLNYVPGQQLTTELPRVGLLNAILINVTGVITCGGGGGVAAIYAPWSFFSRLQLNVNTGLATLFDCSGFGTMVVNSQMIRGNFNPFARDLFQFALNAGANPFEMSLLIPVAVNDEYQFDQGMLNLQAPEIRCTLTTRAGVFTDIGTNITGIVARSELSYLYYEVPDPRTTLYPPLMTHRILEDSKQVTATGDVRYDLPRGGNLLQLAQVVTLNDKLCTPTVDPTVAGTSGQIDSLRLVLNDTETVNNIPFRAFNQFSQRKRGFAGNNRNDSGGYAYQWNFFDSGITGVGEGDIRDTLDSEAVSTMSFYLTVNSGNPIGNSRVDYIRRITQTLQA